MLKRITSLFAVLDKPKATSAELRAALDGLDIAGAESAVDELEARRQSLLLKSGSDTDIEALESEIRSGNREIERRHAAKREIERLLAEADERERLANIEETANKARDLQEELRQLYLKVDGAAATLADLLGRLASTRESLRACNRYTAEHGRPELKVSDPLGLLALHLNRTNPETIAPIEQWRMFPYWPQPATGSHLLGKMAELPPPPDRKAA